MKSLSSSEIKKTADYYRGIAQDIFLVSLPQADAQILDAIERGASPSELIALQRQREDVARKFNDNMNEAISLDVCSLAASSHSTDVDKAFAAISCSTGKVKLAIKRITNLKANLEIFAKFLELGAAIAAATTTGGIASIAAIVEALDQLVRVKFEETLTADELEQLTNELKDCLH
jgi:hypothetical protein